MYVNGNRIFSSGTIVLAAGEIGAIDFPLGPLILDFPSKPGLPPSVSQNGDTLELTNFDGTAELSGSFNFAGAPGSQIAGKTVYLVYAVHNIVTPAGLNWVVHFTVTVV